MERILYVFGGENYSGAEIVIERLFSSNRNNYEPFLLCSPGAYSERLMKQGYRVVVLRNLKNLRRSRNKNDLSIFVKYVINSVAINCAVQKILHKHNISIIHANPVIPAIYLLPSVILSKVFQKNKIFLWSNQDITYYNTIDRQLAKACHKFYTKTIAASNAVKEAFGGYENKTVILHGGIDVNEFSFSVDVRLKMRKQYGISDQTILIGIFGLISERKGHHILFEAFKNVYHECKNIKLVIVGRYPDDDSDYKTLLEKILVQLPERSYMFLGQQDHMNKYYSFIDVLVNSTLKSSGEPLGTTIYEAMACRRIVIASNTGGTPEIVTDNVDGFLFEPDSPEDLKEKLLYVADNYNSMDLVRSKARQKVVEQFNVGIMKQRYNDIIRALK
jgi:glycosyltransferase involved in cell wall biosynthesis